MNCCVGDMKCKCALDKPVVLEIWPIKAKTNLTQDEINSLEETGFVLNRSQAIFPRTLFEGENSIPINKLVDKTSWPTSCNVRLFII